ncbi:hypothetical protein D1872_315980 [compost metagenome]
MVADGHFGVVLYGQIVVGKEMVANLGVHAIVKENRALHEAMLPFAAKQLRQQCFAFLGLVLECAAVFTAQIVGTPLYCSQFRVRGTE